MSDFERDPTEPDFPEHDFLYGPETWLGHDQGNVLYYGPYKPVEMTGAVRELLHTFEERVLFEDDDMLVVDKPPGVVAHAAGEHPHGVQEIARQVRPGVDISPSHRLDRNTSGILVLGKSKGGQRHIAMQFQDRPPGLEKHYLTMVEGHMDPSLQLLRTYLQARKGRPVFASEEPFPGGREALTIVRPLAKTNVVNGDPQTLLAVRILTGRMHQIRASLAHIGHPVAHDHLYRDSDKQPQHRMKLHAHLLAITCPDAINRRFMAETPEDLFWDVRPDEAERLQTLVADRAARFLMAAGTE